MNDTGANRVEQSGSDFSSLAAYQRIIVTGPQRSGTTIAARMIAADTGFAFVDESEIQVDNLRLLRLVMRIGSGVVVHCPALSRNCHEFRHRSGNLVVWMRRPTEEIIRSQERIQWAHAADEILKYGLNPRENKIPVCEIKMQFWLAAQRPLFDQSPGDAMELRYNQLREHRLWIEKAKRSEFGPRQFTEAG